MFSSLLYRRPTLEMALSAIDKSRLKLRRVHAQALFTGFQERPVTLYELPVGPWSSPIADIVMLTKIAACTRPARVLEIGSFRGYTTTLLARHTPDHARIVAFDRDPRHGSAYRGTPLEDKIERRVGEMTATAFAQDPPGSYDLIFIDADHTYAAVKRDTGIALPLLSPNGIVLWHDYANWGRFSRKNGVPEYLHELAGELPVVAIVGTTLAAYSPSWSTGEGGARLNEAVSSVDYRNFDPWETDLIRG